MSRGWKLALGVVIVAAIGVWDMGLPGKHAPAASTALQAAPSASPSASAIPPPPSASTTPVVPHVSGVLQPTGKPEFTAAFTGSNLDTSVWDTCYPQWLSQQGCKNFGNPEYEWYLPSQDQVSGGLLHLVAQRQPTEGTSSPGGPRERYLCRSGMVTSYPGLRFKYGYVQMVAWIPSSPGLWPALWLEPANLTWPPEMDLVESWGHGVYAGSFFHTGHKGRLTSRKIYTPASQVAGWHTFALSWTRTQMTWLIDGKVTMTVRANVPQEKMILIANLAASERVGGANQCTGQLLISSVDVWKA